MERPTRIANNHQDRLCLTGDFASCPIYQGQGIAATVGGAAATTAAPVRDRAPSSTRPALGGRPRPADTMDEARAPGPSRTVSAGNIGPRPRPGGISLPVATIGLLVLAGVIIGLAFFIQGALGDDDDDAASPDPTRTPTSASTRTGTAATTGTVRPGTGTPTTPGTPGTATRTATGTPGATGDTYKVQPGDTCGAIAAANNTTFEELRRLNPAIDADCTNLAVDQVIRLR
jgi:LysM repeat protein